MAEIIHTLGFRIREGTVAGVGSGVPLPTGLVVASMADPV